MGEKAQLLDDSERFMAHVIMAYSHLDRENGLNTAKYR